MAKKLIIFIILILLVGWYLQNYTSFKAFDYARAKLSFAKYYWQKIDWTFLKNVKLPNLNSSATPTPDAEKQLNIFIRDNQFLPNKNGVKVGTKVTWYNEDNKIHSVSSENWGSGELKIGQTYSKVFDLPGTYSYHCSLHPSEKGEIIVQ